MDNDAHVHSYSLYLWQDLLEERRTKEEASAYPSSSFVHQECTEEQLVLELV